MKVRFNWRAWWQAEGFGVIYATVLCFGAALVALVALGDWRMAAFWGLVLWPLCFVYCVGWQLLCLGIASIRAYMGWITYEPAASDQSERSDQ